MKKIPLLIGFLFFDCALTIISPGLNSNYKLNKISSFKFQEAAFYGSTFYDQSAYFLEFENLKLIVSDPNNATFNKNDSMNMDQFDQNNINILYEICYDKEKNLNILDDIVNYKFKLNDFESISVVSYFYPYSYTARGNYIKKYKPYYVNEKYPYQKNIYKTGYDFLMCIRNIVSFRKNVQEISNSLEILTPRNHLFNFSYDFDNKFIFYQNEEMDFSAK
ncbi:hypothetical protein EHQ31_17190 [Leptospira montravelensis]|uniref:Lipoprotein n=1 Tax=Leptospira montravelensis TaxID=2484961 RepID=A0ABY2LRX8_9LEPT|nr:hypothetical protein [Leptospira montravelensis]TGK80352.1 hypothetical protein EHQ19_11760 [Leptospira montravelensis]TGL00528.1 hypothetical protein EHQ31_17190 [Leptospira montravelensis]